MENIHKEIIAVRKVLKECCDQCGYQAICITYFKRLKETISKENQLYIDEIMDTLIKEHIQNIQKKSSKYDELMYILNFKFDDQAESITLAKLLTITLIESKNKVSFNHIKKAIPTWLSKNEKDLILGSVIQFLFYLDEYQYAFN